MLASQTDDGDVLALPTSPTKRKNMIKKTFRAIGKVKPFKKNKTQQMELMNSCSSFCFEAERSDGEDDDDPEANDDDDDDDVHEISDDEDETEVGAITGKRFDVDKACHDSCGDEGQKNDVIHEETRAVTPHEREDMPSSAESTPSSKGLTESARESERMSSKTLRRSRSKGSTKKSNSQAPALGISATSQLGKTGHIMATTDPTVLPDARSSPKSTMLQLEINTQAPEKLSYLKNKCVEQNASSKLLARRSPQQLPGFVEEVEDRGQNDDEPLMRCSQAFADNSAMGGYFAKLQELKNKDPEKSQSYKVPVDRASSTLKPNSAHDLGKSSEDKRRRNFNPSKNIKKLFGLKKTDLKDDDDLPKSPKTNSELSTNDQAAKLMLELSTMFSAHNKAENDERPMKPHTARPSRSFVLEEADDDAAAQNFPEIPAAKKTSLSEIRRMMETSKAGHAGTVTQSSQQSATRRPSTDNRVQRKSHPTRNVRSFVFDETEDENVLQESSNNSAASKANSRKMKCDPPGTLPLSSKYQPVRKSTTENHRHSKSSHERSQRRYGTDNEIDTGDLERTKTRKSMKSSLSPTSVADGPSSETTIDVAENPNSTCLHSAQDEKTPSTSSRKNRGGSVKRASSDSSHGSNRLLTPSHEHESCDDAEESLKPKQGIGRRRRSIRSSTPPAHDTITGNERENDVGTSPSHTESPGSLRRKKMHPRPGDRRSSSASSQSKHDPSSHRRGSSPEAADKLHKQVDHKGSDHVTKPDISDKGHRSLQRIDSKVRPISDLDHLRKSMNSEDRPNDDGKLSSSSNLGRPPLNKSASSRRHMLHLEQNSLPSHHQQKGILAPSNQLDASSEDDKHSALGEKARNPSLAKSLELGKLSSLMAQNDGQYSVSTDGGSEMFVKGKVFYSKIRSDASVGAPQLVFGSSDEKEIDLRVKNV